ncbi:2,5-diketo-D-gluconate reductase B [Haladaptatus litoreus]|uniref:2,5-diketo-D-gluconate reductase B n=1 Tax=Haladaptatus litoreus TaxID=553468 RepID=A0A1N6WVJ2_9EURY|nr:aldo/keto reductase [Haladaptatus litoreus]SIQ94045.1 2,5-diketo-D-gluconate reductase B [Haladaptatus litoreus]
MSTDALPEIGLGTMGISDPERIASAIEMGYRHLDTAQIYENEEVVGKGIELADIPREELFVATKVWADSLAHDDVIASTETSLSKLGLESVDLLYVHRPIESYDPEETLPAFDALREQERIKHVGVSNFTPEELDTAREVLDAPIFAHQVEMHPLFRQADLLADARRHGTNLVAYSPIAQGEVFDLPELTAIAEKHDATEAQVALAWLVETGAVPIPRSQSDAHLHQNLAARNIELSAGDVNTIGSIDREKKLFE